MALETTPAYREQLHKEASEYGIGLTDEQISKLLKHLDLVLEKNKVMNLTRVTNPEQAIRLHILDSLLLTKVPIPFEGAFLDIGTGPGFPGVPFGIVTGLSGDILDSTAKKINADNEMIASLDLKQPIVGQAARVEEYALEHPRAYDIIMARAVAKAQIILEYAAPLQKMGGCLIIAKARIQEDELKAAAKAARMCGYELVSCETFELPNESGHREILIYRKVAKESIKLPRANGVAKQHPLGE